MAKVGAKRKQKSATVADIAHVGLGTPGGEWFRRYWVVVATAQELYDRMLELYPNRVNPGWALWSSVRAVKP